MIDLLLITDVSRLRELFSRLSENREIRLRIANDLEKGGEELIAEKPGIVFVQTHLSGLSGDILLRHLKKQLGRKRSRFVLLAAPSEAGEETLRSYQGHLDTSLGDEALFTSLTELIASFYSKTSPSAATSGSEEPEEAPPILQLDEIAEEELPDVVAPATQEALPSEAVETTIVPEDSRPAGHQLSQSALPGLPEETAREESSLVEQGITYGPRPRISISSEFNSSFDDVVSSIPKAESFTVSSPAHLNREFFEDSDPKRRVSPRSSLTTFLLWLTPVVIAVVVVTLFQHHRTEPVKPAESSPSQKPTAVAVKPLPPPPGPAQESQSADGAAPAAAAVATVAREAAPVAQPGSRIKILPAIIAGALPDKKYGLSHPGWERYTNDVTEFKVRREGEFIKAIQVIDIGGHGVKEPFVGNFLDQLGKHLAFTKESSEKKEGFEIQRGYVAKDIKALFYRDETNSTLRAFVVTWN